MLIIGLDYHPSVQQIAFLDLESGEFGERQLNRNEGEVEEFYRELKQRGIGVRLGMEATGKSFASAQAAFESGVGRQSKVRIQVPSSVARTNISSRLDIGTGGVRRC